MTKRWPLSAAIGLAFVVVATTLAAAPTSASAASAAAPSILQSPQPAPFPGAATATTGSRGLAIVGESLSRPTESSAGQVPPAAAAAAACLAYTRGDNAHRSSTGFEASAHGWWDNVNCSATLADVTVWLQQYYSDGVWRTRGTVGAARVRSGGGSGNRATARALCADSRSTGWRSVVDVDLVGLIDDSSQLVTGAVNIACRRS